MGVIKAKGKYSGVRSETRKDGFRLEGFLYVNIMGRDIEFYIAPYENSKIPANHMYLVDGDSIQEIVE